MRFTAPAKGRAALSGRPTPFDLVPHEAGHRALWRYLPITVVALAILGAYIWYSMRREYQGERAYWQARQSGIADTRVRIVSDWLGERVADGEVLAALPSVRALLSLPGRPQTSLPPALSELLGRFTAVYGYEGIYLFNAEGELAAQAPLSDALMPQLREVARRAVQQRARRIDLLGGSVREEVLSLSLPVLAAEASSDHAKQAPPAVGCVVLLIDASLRLFPLLTRESVPTNTGETLLVRREGTEVVFISPLRHLPAGPKALRRPLDTPSLAAAVALQGREMFGEFTDYRGVRVFATTRRIPLTGWGLVRKIDVDEALAEVRFRVALEALTAALLILAAGGLFLAHRRSVVARVLRREGEKFQGLLESAPDAMVIAGQDGRIVLVNAQAERIFGYAREALVGQPVEMLVPERSHAQCRGYYKCNSGDPPAAAQGSSVELCGLRSDGREFPAEMTVSPQATEEGCYVISAIRDITERKRAEDELRRLNRAFRTVSACNQALVRAKEESALLREICEVLVGSGGYRMAWVGYAEQDKAKSVRPVAQAGYDEGYVAGTNITWADSERGRGPTGAAIRTAHPCVARNTAAEPAFAPWRVEATKRGYGSVIALPLIIQDKPFGALTIYAPEPDAFDQEEMKLLTELAVDVAYGVEALRTREEHARAEEALRASEQHYRNLFENANDIIFGCDLVGNFTSINRAAEQITGYTREEAFGMNLLQVVAPEYREPAVYWLGRAVKGETPPFGQWEIVAKDGRRLLLEVSIQLDYQEGKPAAVQGIARDITERKRAEEALAESEERFRSLVENATMGIYRTTPDGRIVMANPALVRMVGCDSFQELASRNVAKEDFGPNYPRRVFQERMEREGEIKGLEAAWIRRDGSTFFARESARVVRAADGRVLYYDGIVEDITERKRAEEALRESEEKYRTLFESMRQGAFYQQADGTIVDANPAALRMFGLTREELLRRTSVDGSWDVIHEDGSPFPGGEHPSMMALKTGEPVKDVIAGVFNPQRKDYVWMAINAIPQFRPGDATPYRVFVTLHDITERKRAEEALVKLRQAVDTSGEVVFMTHRNGVITFVNPEFTRLYGYTEAEVVGKVTPRILKSETMKPEHYASFWKTLLEKRVAKGEITNRTKDGRLVTVESSANPILDRHGNITGFLAIQRDVTERKQLEEQFRQAQKMEAIGRLAGGIAHDYNNVLTIVTGYGQLLLEELPEKSPLRLQVAEVLKAAERATGLTRQLLAFGRRQVLAPRVLNLNDVVANLESMLRRLIGEDIELVTTPGRKLGRVKADPGQIEQVILNLAVNARDAMPQGGKLTIETSNTRLDEHYANLHGPVQPGSYVMFAVSDTGCGMDAETQAHIFEPFFTTKEKGKGTGLGLATVYGIVKQSGGYIWAYSEVGRGTTFKIYLPRIHEPVEAAEGAPVESASAGGSETILVVEDDSAVRSLVRSVLESRGYSLLLAHNGEEALELCRQHEGPIHLLLTDVVMPGMSGRELAERLTPIHREMGVLYMSGYTDDAIVHHGVLDAGMAYLQKPFSPETLAGKVRSVLDENK
jgi:two-component system cell cycle sensor histidine kinase/response regulator CckA